MTWQQGLRTFPFWIIVAVLFVGSVGMNGTITHLAALLTDRGISPGGAALSASCSADRAWWDGWQSAGSWTDFSERGLPARFI